MNNPKTNDPYEQSNYRYQLFSDFVERVTHVSVLLLVALLPVALICTTSKLENKISEAKNTVALSQPTSPPYSSNANVNIKANYRPNFPTNSSEYILR